MRNDQFTPGAERALDAALRIAGNAQTDSATTRHLALGLLAEEDGPALAMAERCGLQVADWLQNQSISFGELKAAGWNVAAERAIRHARLLAREHFADCTVNCDLLLVAVSRYDPELMTEWKRFGFSAAELERIVIAPLVELVPLAEQHVNPEISDPAAMRVLDANADRAREALRVLEDYCRFVLNDAVLSAAHKQLRHDLAAALPPQARLTAAGDTVNDVGTTISTLREYDRDSPGSVATANSKRLQESLRSLEEYGKLIDPNMARACEHLRYRAYTLEQALQFGHNARQRLANARLYLLAAARPDLKELIFDSAAGGVDMFQLREKQLTDRDLITLARQVRQWTRDAKVLFIVNDRPDIARLCEADGVHLGQDDLPVAHTRRIVGPDAIIGVSTHNLEQLRRAVLDGASYVGVGPTFPSRTKEFIEFAGLDYIRAAVRETELPAFALGGITTENIDQVLAAGAQRIALSATIADSGNTRRTTDRLRETINKNKDN
jgi:thiamine-phosphate pyrophosphorylase